MRRREACIFISDVAGTQKRLRSPKRKTSKIDLVHLNLLLGECSHSKRTLWDAVAILQKRPPYIKNSTRPLRHFIDMFARFPWWNSEMRKHNSFAVWPPNPTGGSKHGNRISLPRDDILPHLSPSDRSIAVSTPNRKSSGRKKKAWIRRMVVLGKSTGNQYG